VGIATVNGNVVLLVKDLFKLLFPTINVEIFDSLLQIATESDPRPLQKLIAERKMNTKLLQAFIALLFNDM